MLDTYRHRLLHDFLASPFSYKEDISFGSVTPARRRDSSRNTRRCAVTPPQQRAAHSRRSGGERAAPGRGGGAPARAHPRPARASPARRVPPLLSDGLRAPLQGKPAPPAPAPAPAPPAGTEELQPVHLAERRGQPEELHVVQVLHLLDQALPVRPQLLDPAPHCGDGHGVGRGPGLGAPARGLPSRSKSFRKALSFLPRAPAAAFLRAGAMRAEERRERTEPRSCSRTAPQHRPRRVQPPPDARLLSNQSSASGGAANRHPARCDDARRGDRPRAAVLRLAEERAAEPGLSELLRRGPRCPSLADALEGLRDAEPYYRHLHRPVAGRGGAPRPGLRLRLRARRSFGRPLKDVKSGIPNTVRCASERCVGFHRPGTLKE